MFCDRLLLCTLEGIECISFLLTLQHTCVCWGPIGSSTILLLKATIKSKIWDHCLSLNDSDLSSRCRQELQFCVTALSFKMYLVSLCMISRWINHGAWVSAVGVGCTAVLFAVHLRNSAGTDFLINMFTKAGCRHVVWELRVADRHSCKRKQLLKRILTNIHACLGAGKWISSLINLAY